MTHVPHLLLTSLSITEKIGLSSVEISVYLHPSSQSNKSDDDDGDGEIFNHHIGGFHFDVCDSCCSCRETREQVVDGVRGS